MEWLKDIIRAIAKALGLSAWTTAYIGLAVVIVLVAVIVIISVWACGKKKTVKPAGEGSDDKRLNGK